VFDGLIRPVGGAWPPPALVMEIGAGEPNRYPFTEELRSLVCAPLGHYCALQSINSEDALTWNLLGTLMHGSDQQRTEFLNWLCERPDLPHEWAQNTRCAIDLWRRIPHPYYPSTDGPELDAVLDGDECVVFVEAKWLSPEGTGRGADDTRVGQMHLRQRFFQRWGSEIYGGNRGMLVRGIVLAGRLVEDAGPAKDGVAVRSITWSELAEYDHHPNGREFRDYYIWKLKHSPRAQKRVAAGAIEE
jgi:hypothetical protein